MNPYLAAFKVDMEIQIIDSQMLEIFMRSWCCHNRLQSEQLSFTEKIARVAKIGFYHRGDPLYELEGIPGVWQEECLTNPRRISG